jgi:hypothetical protein
MKIVVYAKPGSKEITVEKTGENEYKVRVKEPAKEGRANFAIERALARHFGVILSRVKITSGFSSKRKIVEISD